MGQFRKDDIVAHATSVERKGTVIGFTSTGGVYVEFEDERQPSLMDPRVLLLFARGEPKSACRDACRWAANPEGDCWTCIVHGGRGDDPIELARPCEKRMELALAEIDRYVVALDRSTLAHAKTTQDRTQLRTMIAAVLDYAQVLESRSRIFPWRGRVARQLRALVMPADGCSITELDDYGNVF